MNEWASRYTQLVIGMIGCVMGCVIEPPREGYYDHDHHRYYRDHA